MLHFSMSSPPLLLRPTVTSEFSRNFMQSTADEFDNFFRAIWTLFSVVTFEDWPPVLHPFPEGGSRLSPVFLSPSPPYSSSLTLMMAGLCCKISLCIRRERRVAILRI